MPETPSFQQPNFAATPQPVGEQLPVHDAHQADPQLPVPVGVPTKSSTILSDRKFEGYWQVPEQLNITAVMGDVLLDFTQAVFTSQRINIHLGGCLSSTKIRVPCGMTVVNDLNAILTSVKVKSPAPQDPNLPQIVLSGTIVMSDVVVKGPKITLMDRVHGRF